MIPMFVEEKRNNERTKNKKTKNFLYFLLKKVNSLKSLILFTRSFN